MPIACQKLGTWDTMGEKRTSNCLPIVVAGQMSVYRNRCKQGSHVVWGREGRGNYDKVVIYKRIINDKNKE